ncbi:MAG: hypothetical protein DRJ28_05835 [Actinobacteria bacterium]|nr:MAG: hypothetical protein DRJ28_05835 [Actinomycetota bacterium]
MDVAQVPSCCLYDIIIIQNILRGKCQDSLTTTVHSMKLLIRAADNAAIIWFTFESIDGLTFGGDWVALLLVVVLLGFANAFVRPILKLLALPVRIVTLGVATLAINVFVVVGVLWLAEQLDLGVASDGWVPTLLGALIITVLSSIVSAIIKD